MKMSSLLRVLAIGAAVVSLAACSEYHNVPPNYIGMLLTPTGYDGHIYEPGQVDVQTVDANGMGNSLVLIQRSALQVKEGFTGAEDNADHEDHRCLTLDKAPMTMDIRLNFALPDYSTPQGMKDLNRIFFLGNPASDENDKRRQVISAQSIYEQQVQQEVRSKLRQICGSYANFDAAYTAFTNSELNQKMVEAIATVMTEKNVPLRLVDAAVSNMKPDPTVIEATTAHLAAQQRIEAIQVITDFLANDPDGSKHLVYKMQALQEIVNKADTNGHNTIFLTDLTGGVPALVPLPQN